MKRPLVTDHRFDMLPSLTQQGLFATYSFFCSLKEISGCSYILKADIKKSRFSASDRSRYTKQIIKLKWAHWEGDKLKLIAWRKIFKMYGGVMETRIHQYNGKKTYKSNLTRTYGETIKETKARCLAIYLQRRGSQHVKQHYGKDWDSLTSKKKDSIKKARIARFWDPSDPDFIFGFSVRQTSSFIGYKSPMSGTRMLQYMQSIGLAERRDRETFLGNFDDVSFEYGTDFINSHCVVRKGMVFQRDLSEIKLLLK